MNPKMTIKDASEFLHISPRQLNKHLLKEDLAFSKEHGVAYFGYPTARQVFKLAIKPTAISMQIVKGGTGKTTLAMTLAVRASLYGLNVLCIDLDQQGNLTSSLGVSADNLPVMIDILAEGYSYSEAITRVLPGLDLLGSRIENALLDDVIRMKRLKLDQVYAKAIQELKKTYDLIVIDCPPHLGNSVAAVTLAVDTVVAPVVAENYAITGLDAMRAAINDLQVEYNKSINLQVLINKFDQRALLSPRAKDLLAQGYPRVHNSEWFTQAVAQGMTIFDYVAPNIVKREIDQALKIIMESNGNNFVQHIKQLEDSVSIP